MKDNTYNSLLHALDFAMEQDRMSHLEFFLMRIFIDYAGGSSDPVMYASVPTLYRKTNLCKSSIRSTIKRLLDRGLLSVVVRPDAHHTSPKHYSLAPMLQVYKESLHPTATPGDSLGGYTGRQSTYTGSRSTYTGSRSQVRISKKEKEEEEDARDDHAHHENHPTNHHPLTSDQDLDLPHEDSHDRDHLESGKQPETPENRSPDPERGDAPEAQGEPRDRDDSGQDDPVKMESWLANKLQLWHKEFSPGGQPPEIYHAQRIVTYAIDAKIFDTNSSVPFCKFIMDRLRDYTDREAVPHTRKAITWLNRDLKEEYKDHAADYAASIATERDRQARIKEAGQERMREQEEAKRREAAEVARRAKSGNLPHYRTALELDLLKVAISFASSGMVPIGDEVRQDVIDIELVAAANSEYTLNTVTWCELVATCQSLPCWKAAHPGADT